MCWSRFAIFLISVGLSNSIPCSLLLIKWWFFNLPVNQTVNYLCKNLVFINWLFHCIYVLGLRGVCSNPSNPPSYGPGVLWNLDICWWILIHNKPFLVCLNMLTHSLSTIICCVTNLIYTRNTCTQQPLACFSFFFQDIQGNILRMQIFAFPPLFKIQ